MKTKPKDQPKAPQKAQQKILVVDPHPVYIDGIRYNLPSKSDLVIVGTADDLHVALEQIVKLQPDLVVIEISLKGSNGIELLKNIKVRFPKLLVLMVSMHDESLYARRALRAGAAGYIMKHETGQNILAAIRQVLNGEVYISEKMDKKMRQQLVGGRAPRTGSPIEDLSDRELEVFGLIGQGHGARQIAEQLHLSVNTIRKHFAGIKEKMNLCNMTELVQHAIQWREA